MDNLQARTPRWLHLLTLAFVLGTTALSVVLLSDQSRSFIDTLIPCLAISLGGAQILGFVYAIYIRQGEPKESQNDIIR